MKACSMESDERRGVALATMSESLRFTVIYEDAGDGWTMARIAEVPEIITQGATVEEARRMVQSALRDWLEFYVRDQAGGKAVEVPPGGRKALLVGGARRAAARGAPAPPRDQARGGPGHLQAARRSRAAERDLAT